MGVDEHSEMGFQQIGGKGMYAVSQPGKVVRRTMSSASLSDSSNGTDSFFSNGWDPLVSMSQSLEFRGSSMAAHHHQVSISSHVVGGLENHGGSSASFAQYPSDASFVELGLSKLPCFGSGSFSEMVSSLGMSEYGQITDAMCPSDYPSMAHHVETKKNSPSSRKIIDRNAIFQDDVLMSEEGGRQPSSSPNEKKRKNAPECGSGITHSQLNSLQCSDAEKLNNDPSQETLEEKEQDEKKQKTEKNTVGNSRGKPNGKQSKGNSQNEQGGKEDYIHVRARRGQATNSHSLAERVRREKISQRMRFLQDLVPGCNKITGKALMLDEIINYVQSLQRQVEFLSMKLATVNPELNIDIDRILSKEVRVGSSPILGFGPPLNPPHPQAHLMPQRLESQLPSMPQIPSVWDEDLQNAIQMGFIPNTAIDIMGPNAANWKSS
ncbi:hypothetical protein Syun_004519 [Stephania yunnanensis]|uniref:BHLH domain-containing protein n=1 Tax=Stephania yunnanensis TaxID=152371 RepID=A0AAP0L368_9MAGN